MGPAMTELLRRISSGEGTYTSVNRGRAGDTPGGQANLTSLPLSQIMERQRRGDLFAVGAYQFIPDTLAGAVKGAGIDPNTPFSPQVQDRLARQLILGGSKRPGLTRYLTGGSNDLPGATDEIASEWAALRGSGGRGKYDGDKAGNMASIGVADLLPRVRSEVMKGGSSLDAPASPPAAQVDGGGYTPLAVTPAVPVTEEDVFAKRLQEGLSKDPANAFDRAFGIESRRLGEPQRMAGMGLLQAYLRPLRSALA
jgi:hypothetical protein